MIVASTTLEEVLLALKIAFLVLLYAFIWQIVRTAGRGVQIAQQSVILRPQPAQFNIAETASELICHASEELHMKVIAVFTETGSTARLS